MANNEELKHFVALKDVIVEKMKDVKNKDLCYCPQIKKVYTAYEHGSFVSCGAFLLPPVIDFENPERGLIGMFLPDTLIFLKPVFSWGKGGFLEGQEVDNDNKDNFGSVHIGEWACKVRGMDQPFIAYTPTLAVLKALAWQNKIEVEDE